MAGAAGSGPARGTLWKTMSGDASASAESSSARSMAAMKRRTTASASRVSTDTASLVGLHGSRHAEFDRRWQSGEQVVGVGFELIDGPRAVEVNGDRRLPRAVADESAAFDEEQFTRKAGGGVGEPHDDRSDIGGIGTVPPVECRTVGATCGGVRQHP